MTAALAAALLLLSSCGQGADPQGAAFDARMAASAEAAERLQGDLDGHWILVNARGRPLFVFEISDPPGGAAPLAAGWRAADGAGLGVVQAIARTGRRLKLAFAVDGRSVRLDLRRRDARRWRGWLMQDDRRREACLERRVGRGAEPSCRRPAPWDSRGAAHLSAAQEKR